MKLSTSNFALLLGGVAAAVVVGCASLRSNAYARPVSVAGEWVDASHTTPTDTSLWILRADGYDGSAHIRVERDASGGATIHRSQTRYGTWYLNGDAADSAHRAICFARRLGRDGATCLSYSLDSAATGGEARRRLIIHGYRGEHHIGDRELIEHPQASQDAHGP